MILSSIFPNFERYCETIIIIGVDTTTEKSAANRDTLKDPTTPPNTALTLFPAESPSAYGSVDVSTSNFDEKVDQFKDLVEKYNGNISDTYLSSNYQGLKNFSITSNIPAEDFDEFLAEVENIEKFSDISINANDVTTYVLDIDSRLLSLLNEKKALEEIKLEAKTTSERLEVQNQLRYVNQDIERLKGQKEYYENATSYSTLTLNIREGSGISLFSWNYYFQRSLNWIEGIVGVTVSLGVILVPVYLLFVLFKKIRKKE